MNITTISRTYGRYIELVDGGYKLTYNWGVPHWRFSDFSYFWCVIEFFACTLPAKSTIELQLSALHQHFISTSSSICYCNCTNHPLRRASWGRLSGGSYPFLLFVWEEIPSSWIVIIPNISRVVSTPTQKISIQQSSINHHLFINKYQLYIWANFHNSLTWNKAIGGDFAY